MLVDVENTDDAIKLMRHHLGSIDLSDIEQKEQSEQERKDYCAAIHAVFPRLERDLKWFLYHQTVFVAKESESWEHVAFGRGGIDALTQLLNHWRMAHQEFLGNSTSGDFDRHAPFDN